MDNIIKIQHMYIYVITLHAYARGKAIGKKLGYYTTAATDHMGYVL